MFWLNYGMLVMIFEVVFHYANAGCFLYSLIWQIFVMSNIT